MNSSARLMVNVVIAAWCGIMHYAKLRITIDIIAPLDVRVQT
jgi:hypothetical protein